MEGKPNRLPEREKGRPRVYSLGAVEIAYGSSLDLPWGGGHCLAGFLDFPRGGVTIWRAFSEVEFELRQLPGEGAWNRVFCPAFHKWIQETGVKPPTK